MSKTVKLLVISVLCLFLATTFVSAGLLDYFTGKDVLTGNVLFRTTNKNKYDVDGNKVFNKNDETAMTRCNNKDTDFNGNAERCDIGDIIKLNSVISTYDINRDKKVDTLDVNVLTKCNNKDLDFNKNGESCDIGDLTLIQKTRGIRYDVDGNTVSNKNDITAMTRCNNKDTDFNSNSERCDIGDITKLNSAISTYDTNGDKKVDTLDVNVLTKCNNKDLDFNKNGESCDIGDLVLVSPEATTTQSTNAVTRTAASSSVLPYDVNDDGVFTQSDVIKVARTSLNNDGTCPKCDVVPGGGIISNDVLKIGRELMSYYDVNGDGKISKDDLDLVSRASLKQATCSKCDLNKKDGINSADVLLMSKYLFDVNEDGVVDSKDKQRVADASIGKVSCERCDLVIDSNNAVLSNDVLYATRNIG